MRLIGLKVENFRCYGPPTEVRFGDLTALVGRNDVGKSSLMDAMAIFFEVDTPDKDDICKGAGGRPLQISCEFDQLPAELVVDTDFPTTLQAEHLVSARGTLVIRKTFNATPKIVATEAMALHPTAANYGDLLALKKADLAKRAAELGVDLAEVDKRANAPMRAAIWRHGGDLPRSEVSVSLDAEGSKQVWASLQPYLPTFALFKSDRASTDQDPEAQDPLKAAIKEAIKGVEDKLIEVKRHVESEVRKIAAATLEKMKEMDASLAETLDPVISTKRWDTLFSTSITGDEGVPLNKRGSGVKRVILLNFFRAKAEKDAAEKNASSVIYAIEEPETSQHPRNQRLLLAALRDLSALDGRQVIITTHTPMLARYLPQEDLRFVQRWDDGSRTIDEASEETITEIARSLGVLPDHNVKVFVGVEGPHDITFLKGIARMLIAGGENVPDLDKLELEGELIFVPFGGSNLALWASRLRHLNRPEFHACDRDVAPPTPPKYADHMAAVNLRAGCEAVATEKREMENYIHHEAIVEAYAGNGIAIVLGGPFGDFDDVPSIVAEAVNVATGGGQWEQLDQGKRAEKVKKAKRQLNGAGVLRMTPDRLTAVDPNNEIRGWLSRIAAMLALVEA